MWWQVTTKTETKIEFKKQVRVQSSLRVASFHGGWLVKAGRNSTFQTERSPPVIHNGRTNWIYLKQPFLGCKKEHFLDLESHDWKGRQVWHYFLGSQFNFVGFRASHQHVMTVFCLRIVQTVKHILRCTSAAASCLVVMNQKVLNVVCDSWFNQTSTEWFFPVEGFWLEYFRHRRIMAN